MREGRSNIRKQRKRAKNMETHLLVNYVPRIISVDTSLLMHKYGCCFRSSCCGSCCYYCYLYSYYCNKLVDKTNYQDSLRFFSPIYLLIFFSFLNMANFESYTTTNSQRNLNGAARKSS